MHLQYAHAIDYNEALAAAREGALDEAVANAQLALQQRPDFVPAHVLLAKVHARQQNWPKAQASANRAVELAPSDEAVTSLAAEIERDAERAARDRMRQQRKAAAVRRRDAEQTLATYERSSQRAFGLGAGLVAALALLVSWLTGRRRK
jgi:tetratricopeptide (TPR) repeat protein